MTTDDDTLRCLHCGAEVYAEGNIIPQCPRCGFYNIKLRGEDFEGFMDIYDIDPIFVHKKDREDGFCHYAWPPLTKEEYILFEEKSPKRAKALLKLLKGEQLTEREDNELRVFKSRSKPQRRDLESKLQYLQTKKKILDILEKLK
jgi:NAD-dependent SIR2 family protein deacetylase